MRKISLVLNFIVVIFFVGLFSYSIVARGHLDSLARAFVTEKTLNYSKTAVVLAEGAVDSPLVGKLLSEDQINRVRKEIVDYRAGPEAYVSDLTREDLKAIDTNPLLGNVVGVKENIRNYYDNSLDALIDDLRIFSITNLVAGLIAFNLAYHSPPKIRYSIAGFSFLMFVAVLYSSYLYVDELTFFRILFRSHLGWAYPIFLCCTVIALYLDYGRVANGTQHSNDSKRDKPGENSFLT